MTDTMGGGRGGVGIRLFVSGGEVAKRTFDQVGDSGQKMWAQIALGEKSANPALRAMSRGAGEVQGAVQGLGSRAGAAANVLGAFGATGVVAAAGLGALVLALDQTRAAMSFADELQDSAAKINIGVEALQEWRFAAVEAGGAATDADAAIDGFQKKLGEAMAGGRSLKWFERLFGKGFDVKSFKSTEEALDATIDKISALGTEAERAAISEKLGLGPLTALIREGTFSIEEMRQRARDLGVVMDESMVQRGAEAQREMEVLSQVIDLQLKQAFIDLAPVLLETLKFVGWLAEGIRDAAEAWKTLDDRSSAGLRDEYDRHQAVMTRMLNRPGVNSPDDLDPLSRRQFDQSNVRMGEITGALQRRAAARGPAAPPPRGGGLNDVASPRGGGGVDRAARQAEQRRREGERALEQLREQELKAERDALQARFGSGGTEENRTELALAMVTIETEAATAAREALRAALDKAGVLDDIAEARLEELRIAQGEAAKARDTAILQEEQRDIAARRLEQERSREEDAIALMDIDLELVRSAQERAAIARRILLAQQALEAKILAAELGEDKDGLTADDQARLDRLRSRQGREVELFDQNAREDLRQEFVSYGQSIVQAVEEGRLGEEIADQLKARLIDMALNGLFNFLNPQGGPGASGQGSSVWSTAATVISQFFGAGRGAGRAGGGPTYPGMRHPVVEDGRPELLMIGGKGQVTSAAETVRMLRDAVDGSAGGANGGRTVVHKHYHQNDLRGAVMTQDLLDQMNGLAKRAETAAVGRSLDISRRSAPGLQQRMRRLGTP